MKIIERREPTERINCPHCTSILEYTGKDINEVHGLMNIEDYIVCPVCSKKIVLERRSK